MRSSAVTARKPRRAARPFATIFTSHTITSVFASFTSFTTSSIFARVASDALLPLLTVKAVRPAFPWKARTTTQSHRSDFSMRALQAANAVWAA